MISMENANDVNGAGKCDLCTDDAKIVLPYGPHKYCHSHFIAFFEKRIRRTVRQQSLVKPGEKIAIGVSGGKDSAVTLHLLHGMISKTNEIEAVMIDEGIPGYRDVSLEMGKELCKMLDVPYTLVNYRKEVGITMTQIKDAIDMQPALGTTCSFCGTFRRHLLNKVAFEIGAQKIATGHNLDDEVQSICMNFFDNDLKKMARLGAVVRNKVDAGLVPRIKPLYETPEKEVIAYAALKELPHYSDECCPFSYQAKRNYFREMLNNMENELPGTKFKILRTFQQMKPFIEPLGRGVEISYCTRCGAASNGGSCGTCRKIESLSAIHRFSAKQEKGRKLSCTTTKNM